MPFSADIQTSAAVRLQQAWRTRFAANTLYKAVVHNEEAGVTNRYAQSIGFEQLKVVLRRKSLISAVKACLMRIHTCAVLRHKGTANRPTLNVRVFIAAFMIAHWPTYVFRTMGALELALYNTSRSLLAAFGTICDRIVSHHSFAEIPASETEQFPKLMVEYFDLFAMWRQHSPAQDGLLRRVEYALATLYEARAHLPPNAEQRVTAEIELQISRLRVVLVQLGGGGSRAEAMEQ